MRPLDTLSQPKQKSETFFRGAASLGYYRRNFAGHMKMMKNFLICLIGIAVVSSGLIACKKPAAMEPTGFWKGGVDVNGNNLQIYLRITKEPDGKLKAAALNITSNGR